MMMWAFLKSNIGNGQVIRNLKKTLFKLVPVFIVKNSYLKKWIHHKPIPSRISSFVIKGSNVKLISDSSPIVTAVYWLGVHGYEKKEIELWAHLCKSASNVVEIGGNIGYFTVFGGLANQAASYTVYEPLPYNFHMLKRNIDLNKLSNVNVINSAVVSNQEIDEISFYLPMQEIDYKAATGGYIAGAEAMDRPSCAKIKVSVIQSSKALVGCDLLKLDVEGAEFEILSGGSEQIQSSKPIMLIEMRKGTTNLRKWIETLLEKSNYQAWVLSKNSGWTRIESKKISSIVLQDEYGTRDLLLFPEEKKYLVFSF